ncbi:MAG: hypothetical protein V4508_26975 [Pseudomonadota bacterium]
MKRLLVVGCCALVLSACSMFKRSEPPVAAAPAKPAPTQLVDADGVPIETIEFRAGVSTVTVEKLARQHDCTGGAGAGLVTEPGPVEVYRMICENGKVFKARCELRQCKPM